MAESAGISKISYSHEALVNWLVVNPHRPLRDAAAYFGYTQAWISTVIHSDIFQAKLAARQEEVFAQVAGDIPEKLRAAADIALSRVTEKLEVSDDGKFLLDATDKLLHRMGYAPAGARNPLGAPVVQNNTQINNFSVSSEDLEAARQAARGLAEQSKAAPLLIENGSAGEL